MEINDDLMNFIHQAMADYDAEHGISNRPCVEVPEESLLQENSKSVVVSETTSRFSSAIWYDEIKKQNITLAGLGGIGSWVALLLSRMTPNSITLYDDDVVEAGNLSGQLFGFSHIGSSKVSSISNMIAELSHYYAISTFQERFTENSLASNIMICGFDNMEARTTFFNKWLQKVEESNNPEDYLLIDGRLAAEELQVFTLTGDNKSAIEDYRTNRLFSDHQADQTICSYKQTSFCANMIASFMVNSFVNFIANKCNPLISRDLPYLIQYDASTMFLKFKQ